MILDINHQKETIIEQKTTLCLSLYFPLSNWVVKVSIFKVAFEDKLLNWEKQFTQYWQIMVSKLRQIYFYAITQN